MLPYKLFNIYTRKMRFRKLIVSICQSKLYTSSVTSGGNAEKWIVPIGRRTDISVYNPITKTKVPLILRNWDYVTWYMCGPTVYDSAHLGHASCYVKFDIVRKILTNVLGLHLVQAMSITDIDDKIVERARRQGEEAAVLARRYSREFFQDMAALGVEPPTLVLAVTEHVPHILAFVQALVDRQAAYPAADGCVYFDTARCSTYGKLSTPGRPDAGAEPGEERGGHKRSGRDFALWKAGRPGEPAWSSPWGAGRPGWHVECSAMASAVFGRSVDLHSGGLDLLFPHHENEEAQSCCYHDTLQWVNYWLHAGQLRVAGDTKMSKSVGNTVSVQQFLSSGHSATHFRLFCLMSRYRAGVEYSPQAMHKAVAVCRRLENFLHHCQLAQARPHCVDGPALLQRLAETRRKFRESLVDDFDTASALAAILELVSFTNKMLQQSAPHGVAGEAGMLAAVSHFVRHSLAQLGVHFHSSSAHSNHRHMSEEMPSVEAVLDAVVQFRSHVRQVALQEGSKEAGGVQESLLDACDSLRQDLRRAGVQLEDRGRTCSWSVSSRSPS